MSELNHMHENISGIYNYCDRWCEKCSFTNRCLLFKREAERDIMHILKDEDPNDPTVFTKDISDSFQDTIDLLNEKMDDEDTPEYIDEEDFDFDDDDDDPEDKDFLEDEIDEDERPTAWLTEAKHPLIDMSMDLFNAFDKYYDIVKNKYPENFEENNTGNLIRENLSVLGWYTPQINVKARMCVWGKNKLAKTKSKLHREIDEELLNVNCRIAYTGIEKCIKALSILYEMKPELQTETLLMLNTAKKIKDVYEEEFPSVLTFKRPYFD